MDEALDEALDEDGVFRTGWTFRYPRPGHWGYRGLCVRNIRYNEPDMTPCLEPLVMTLATVRSSLAHALSSSPPSSKSSQGVFSSAPPSASASASSSPSPWSSSPWPLAFESRLEGAVLVAAAAVLSFAAPFFFAPLIFPWD